MKFSVYNCIVKLNIRQTYYKYGAIVLILLFAAVQFFLILRHKSPYLSDSYFYQHIFYELKGENFDSAREKVKEFVDLKNADEIGKNIFENPQPYRNSYGFFIKRPLYPVSAYLVNMIIPNVYLSFLIPVLAAYLGTIVLVYIFSVRELGKLYGIATTALFISFYPFLDWSTYFMTDTIGAFFWLLQLFFIYKFIKTHTNKWLVLFAAVLAISLLNREQNVLMVPLLGLFQVLGWAFKMPVKNKNSALMLFGISIFVVFVFIVTSFILGQKNILDTLVYTQNSYGLKNNTYTAKETLDYIIRLVKVDHIVFVRELVQHHWWFLLSVLSIFGVFKTVIFKKDRTLITLLIFSSGVASYLSIFIYPMLSYRFFYPLLFAVIFFAMKFTKGYFEKA